MTRAQRHILFWVAYIFFKTYLNIADDLTAPFRTYMVVILCQVAFLIVKIPVVYTCFFLIDRYMEMRWPRWKSVLFLVGVIAIGSVGMNLVNHLIVYPMILERENNSALLSPASLFYSAFMLVFVAGLAVSIRLFRRQYDSRMREIILQKEKTETELKYLKGQINPHFLFNTLNNIYSLAMKGSDQTSEAILRLSKMMRFVLYESGNAEIPLRDELTLIQDYIKLEKLRYTNRLEVVYTESIDNPGRKIGPLLLIHFVENAFKHGVSESRTHSFVNVNIVLKDDVLTATVVNSKSGDVKKNNLSIGMENIRKQLNILYPKHRLDIRDDDQKYSIELVIPFND